MIINNDVVDSGEYGEHFNVMLSESENPSVKLTVDFTGMPVKTLMKLAFNEIKVKARPAMKKLTPSKLKEVYDGETLNWRVLLSKEGAAGHLAETNMSAEELDAHIEKLRQRQMELKKASE